MSSVSNNLSNVDGSITVPNHYADSIYYHARGNSEPKSGYLSHHYGLISPQLSTKSEVIFLTKIITDHILRYL